MNTINQAPLSTDRSHKISPEELESMLNSFAVIPTVELAINIEKNAMEANQVIKDELGYLTSDYKVTQLKLLMSWLRRRGRI